MAQMTAVEDLIIALKKFMELDGVDPDTIDAAIEFAENRKEMEEEQIKGAYNHGQKNGYNYRGTSKGFISGELYYEQTYKTQSQ